MERLRTTPAQLRTQAGRLQAEGETIATIVEKMISLVDSIGVTTWSGDAASRYKSQFDELGDDAGRMRNLLNDTCDKLEQIASAYQDAEDANVSLAGTLPTDVF